MSSKKITPASHLSGSFKKYTLSRRHGFDVGITDIPTLKMSQSLGPGLGADEQEVIDLGFTFFFNGCSYSQIRVCVNGWIILGNRPYSDFTSAPESSYAINTDITANDGVLLAPWFAGLKTVDPRSPGYGSVGGVWYKKDEGPHGVRGIIRWICELFYSDRTTLIFECVLYEGSGKIEFRYSKTYENVALSTLFAEPINWGSAIGVWTTGSNNWRDFTRTNVDVGGAIYDAGYTYTEPETVDPQTAPWFFGGRTLTLVTASVTYPITWPTTPTLGVVYEFSPPMSSRRNSPREDLRKIDSNSTIFSQMGSSFDDRRSINITNSGTLGSVVGVNFPTSLPILYANSSENPSLLLSTQTSLSVKPSDFPGKVIGTGTSVSSIEQWLELERAKTIPESSEPFDESVAIELSDSIRDTEFYASGTKASDYALGFGQNIGAKTIIRLRYTILSETLLRGSTSSIYYYDPYRMTVCEWIGDDLRDPGADYSPGAMVDSIGFTPLGTFSSNVQKHDYDRIFKYSTVNDNPYGTGYQHSDRCHPGCATGFGSYDTTQWKMSALNSYNSGAITVSSSYAIAKSGTISLNGLIDRPFLVEKVIVRMPIKAGPGWTQDMTRTKRTFGFQDFESYGSLSASLRPTYASGSLRDSYEDWPIDVGGPCITVGLMNQLTPSCRDVVVTGTIIPTKDNVSGINFELTHLTSAYGVGSVSSTTIEHHSLTFEGFKSFGRQSSAVVYPDDSGYFTGSVVVPMDVMTSNGVISQLRHVTGDGATYEESDHFCTDDNGDGVPLHDYYAYGTGLVDKMTYLWTDVNGDLYVPPIPYLGSYCEETVTLGSRKEMIMSINPCSRNQSGFSHTGRSIRDMSSIQSKKIQNTLYPFKSKIEQFLLSLSSSLGSIYLNTGEDDDVPIARFEVTPDIAYVEENVQVAPYVLDPKDRLIFFISKCRPVKSCSANYAKRMNGIETPVSPGSTSGTGSAVSVTYSVLTGSHDVRISAGTLEISLFGSYVQEGVERDAADFSKHEYGDVVHDVVGDDPVVDQYDSNYTSLYYKTYTDQIVTGSLFEMSTDLSTKKSTFTMKERGVISWNTSAKPKWSSGTDYVTSASLMYDRRGTVTFAQCHDYRERFWDTLLPSLSDVWKRDDVNVYDDFIYSDWWGGISSTSSAVFYVGRQPKPCHTSPTNPPVELQETSSLKFTNMSWLNAFPFEPRYSTCKRMTHPFKSISTTKKITDWDAESFTQIDQVRQRDQAFLSICTGDNTTWFPYKLGINFSNWKSWYPASLNFIYGSAFADSGEFVKAAFGYSSVKVGASPLAIQKKNDGALSQGTPYDTSLTSKYPSRTFLKLKLKNDTRTENTDVMTIFFHSFSGLEIEGWKYGVLNGFRQTSKTIFRRDSFGQPRDMLEQRLDGKFFYEETETQVGYANPISIGTQQMKDMSLQIQRRGGKNVTDSPVFVKFVGPDGKWTEPERTESGNLDYEATSSLPYFDNQVRNRTSEWTMSPSEYSIGGMLSVLNSQLSLDTNVVSYGPDENGNIVVK